MAMKKATAAASIWSGVQAIALRLRGIVKLLIVLFALLGWFAVAGKLWWSPRFCPRASLADTGSTDWTHRCFINSFSPDGQTLAVWRWKDSIQLWDIAQARERITIQTEDRHPLETRFSPDSQLFITQERDGLVFWDVATGRQRAVLPGEIRPLAISPDSKLLAGKVQPSGELRLWNIPSGTEQADLRPGERHWDYRQNFCFSPNGEILAFASEDRKSVHLWDTRRGLERAPLRGSFNSLAFSKDGRLAAIAEEQSVNLYETVTWQKLGTLKLSVPNIQAPRDPDIQALLEWWHPQSTLAFAPNGRVLACASWDEKAEVELWDVIAMKHLATARDSLYSDYGMLMFSPNSDLLGVQSQFVTTDSILWRVDTAQPRMLFMGGAGPGSSFRRAKTGHNMAFMGDGRTLLVKDMASSEEVTRKTAWRMGQPNQIQAWCYRAEEWLAQFFGRRHLRHGLKLVDMATGRVGDTVADCGDWLLSPDGKTVATQGYDEQRHPDNIKLWDVPPQLPTGVRIALSVIPPSVLVIGFCWHIRRCRKKWGWLPPPAQG